MPYAHSAFTFGIIFSLRRYKISAPARFCCDQVINSTRWLLSRAFNVLLEGVPEEVNYNLLKSRLGGITGKGSYI